MGTPSRHLMAVSALILTLVSDGPAFAVEFCKWTDESGVVHYSEDCPEDVSSTVVPTQDKRTQGQIQAAEEHSKSLLSQTSTHRQRTRRARDYRSLSLEQLGPLPSNTSSEFLETTGTLYAPDFKSGTAILTLFLETTRKMPEGAWVEAEFPNLADIGSTDRVGKEAGPGQEIILESPPASGLVCWNYEVQLSIYSDAGKETLLGTHRQVIQSRVNMDRVKSVEGMADNLTDNRCVQGDHKKLDRMSAEKLEALCQQEREKRLAPERERLIKDCVERQGKSQEHCENFYHDFGDAMRIDRWTMRRELYMDLPECVAAREARAKEQ